MLTEALARVLAHAPDFSTVATVEMQSRDAAVREAADSVRRLLVEALGVGPDVLSVAAGGRQSNYSPVPWVRIFDRSHSPNAMAGYYVVFLFAADGSSVYLSLNQGTSEWRANKWRPIRDPDELRHRAAIGRSGLRGWDSLVLREGDTVLDLRPQSVDVGPESRQRIRNYELANVAAYRYDIAALPTDDVLAGDLAELVTLLWDLQGYTGGADDVESPLEAPAVTVAPSVTVRRRGARQGRRVDAQANKACEMHAVNMAMKYFRSKGWEDVRHVGDQGMPYDLECRAVGRPELRVEVKGTSSRGVEVFLTPNEVEHTLAFVHVALVVVSEITISEDYTSHGGVLRVFDPWELDRSRLRPTEYVYTVGP